MPASLGDVTKSVFNKDVEQNKIREEFEVLGLTQTIAFDADLITANVFDIDVNGVPLASIPFNTSNVQTLVDIATALAALSSIDTAVSDGGSPGTITITPVDQDGIALSGGVVTGGAGQAVVTVDTQNNKIKKGMPVEIDPATGKILPLTNDADLEYIGVSLHDADADELATIALRGFAVIFATSSEAVLPGPVNWNNYDAVNAVNRYNQTAVTSTTFQGWAIDEATGADEDIRVIVRT